MSSAGEPASSSGATTSVSISQSASTACHTGWMPSTPNAPSRRRCRRSASSRIRLATGLAALVIRSGWPGEARPGEDCADIAITISTVTDLQPIGPQHPRIRQVVAIQRNSAPNPHKLFVAEGLWAHNLLLEHGIPVDTFFWSPESAYGDEARKRAGEVAAVARNGYQISARTMEKISERDKPDGLLSLAQLPRWEPDDIELGRNALIMVADGMEIAGHLGPLIRTADACRVDCLVLTNRRTRLTHPKVFRASQGMMLTLPIVEFETPDEALAWLRRHRFDIYLADTDNARSYREYDYRRRRTAFVMG